MLFNGRAVIVIIIKVRGAMHNRFSKIRMWGYETGSGMIVSSFLQWLMVWSHWLVVIRDIMNHCTD